MKVLVIQQKMIGDVLTSSILCEAIKQKHPSAELHYLINSHTVPVVENNPFIDQLVIYSPEIENSIFRFFKFLQQIKAEKYDVVIDVYQKNSSFLITYASQAKIRIGKKKWFLKKVYTHQIKNQKKRNFSTGLAYENRLQMLRPILNTVDFSILPKIYIRESEKNQLRKKLLEKGIDTEIEPYIMINILGSSKEKTYPFSSMAYLLDKIANNFPEIKFFFNYIPTQKPEVEQLKEYCSEKTKQQISSFYAPSLREFIVLCSFCKMIIGNEGGAINMGKALKIPTFAIFSPWIRKETWGTTKEDKENKAVHLKDYQPELFKDYKQKVFKEKSTQYYRAFHPEMIIPELIKFVEKIQ